jgi:hypothetical protein
MLIYVSYNELPYARLVWHETSTALVRATSERGNNGSHNYMSTVAYAIYNTVTAITKGIVQY